jgi:hypothetical protein
MQLAVAAVFALQAIYSVIVSLIFINPTNMRRVLEEQGTQIPQGSNIDTVVGISVAVGLAFVIVIALCEVVAAIGSYLGWRWMFWVALALFGLGAIGAVTNLPTLMRPETTPIPAWGVIGSELFALANLAVFVWMLIGLVRFGPWAMKRPG